MNGNAVEWGRWIEAAFWTNLGGLAVYASLQIPSSSLAGESDPGPRAFPLTMSLVLLSGGIIQFILASISIRRATRRSTIDRSTIDIAPSSGNWRLAAGIAAVIGYGLFAPWAGFSLATMAFLSIWQAFFRRPVWQILLVSVVLTASVVLVFGILFEVQLPHGWSSVSGRKMPIDIP